MSSDTETRTLLGQNGLPKLTDDKVDEKAKKGQIMFIVLNVMPRLIGVGISYTIFHFGDAAAYKEQMYFLGSKNLGYGFAAVLVFCILSQWLNTFPMIMKMKLDLTGNLQSNMAIYQNIAEHGKAPLPYVVLVEEGLVGEYNRANRSLAHFNETMGGLLVALVCAGFVFPFPTLICASIFAVGRVLHQIGYTYGGHGKHAPGFLLAMLSSVTIEGMVFWACLGSFGKL